MAHAPESTLKNKENPYNPQKKSEGKKETLTMRKLTPRFLKLSMTLDLPGLERVESLTRTEVRWPALALASTMNFPMYPVPPMNKILLFVAIA